MTISENVPLEAFPPLELSAILDEPLDWRFRGFPDSERGLAVRDVGGEGWHVLRDFHLPVLTLSAPALDHNIALLAGYCAERDLSLAPHAKTPMAPQILERQRVAGAWAASAATVDQVRVLRACGTRRIILANEVVDPGGLAWLARELRDHPDLELYVFVDSTATVRALENALGLAAEQEGPSARVLIEAGHAGGRAGCRSSEDALAVASAVSRARGLVLAGVAAYEGSVGADGAPATLAAVDRFLEFVRTIAEDLAREGHFGSTTEVVVSAGGSAFFDRAAAVLGRPWALGSPVRVVLRSGSYVAHDSGHYERLSPLDGRSPGGARLRPALEVWGSVISRQDEGRAIVAFGKRDAPHDLELPIPFAIAGARGHRDGTQLTITALNDHHAFVDVPHTVELAVGELVGARIVHPCTAFDKWRLLPLIDEDYIVVDAIRTIF